MSAFGTKRTSQHAGLMSDFGGIANIVREDGWPIGSCERAALAENFQGPEDSAVLTLSDSRSQRLEACLLCFPGASP
jgi:hypothetical protein